MNRKSFLALVVAPMVLGLPAQAATISFSDTFGPENVPFPETALATLQQFDPVLGTLTKVTLTLDANTSAGTIAWDNEALVTTDIELGIGAEVTATALAGLAAVAVPLQTDSTTGLDADNDGAADFLGTDAFAVMGGSGSDSDADTLTTGLGPYIGLGTFDVTLEAKVETFLSSSGGFGPIDPQPGVTDGMVTIEYEYTPIPEPSSLSLLAMAAWSVCWSNRSMRQRN